MKIGRSVIDNDSDNDSDNVSAEAEAAATGLCVEAVATDCRKRDESGVVTTVIGIGLVALIIVVYLVTHNSFATIVSILCVGLLVRKQYKSSHTKETEFQNRSLLLENCWGSPVLRTSSKTTRERRSVVNGEWIKRAPHASGVAWSAAWEHSENTVYFEKVLSSRVLVCAEILEELLVEKSTRLPVLNRLSQENWESARGWGQSQNNPEPAPWRGLKLSHGETQITLCLLAITPDIAQEVDTKGLVRIALGSQSKLTRELGIRVLAMGGRPEMSRG